jgi:hypothetical protein
MDINSFVEKAYEIENDKWHKLIKNILKHKEEYSKEQLIWALETLLDK